MKFEKKHWGMLAAGVIALILVYWFFFRKKKTESAYNKDVPLFGLGMDPRESGYAGIYGSFGNESGYDKIAPSRIAPSRTQSSYAGVYGSFGNESGFKATSKTKVVDVGTSNNPSDPGAKWVSSVEGGKPFCRWYDGNGNNTVTYERPCTKAQANM